MRQIVEGEGIALFPRMTRVVDFSLSENNLYYEIIVESPDIEMSVDDMIPLLELDVQMRSVAKDDIVPHIPIVAYVVISGWKDCPESRNIMPYTGNWHDIAGLLQAPVMDSARQSGAYAAVSSHAFDGGIVTPYGSTWSERVAKMDDVQTRQLLVVMLKTFWGGSV